MLVKSSFYNEIIPVEESNEYLIYNIINGGLNVIDAEMGKFLEKHKESNPFDTDDYPDQQSTMEDMYANGYIVANEVNEIVEYQENHFQSQKRKYEESGHIGLTIGTTITCNMGCPYCFETTKPSKSLKDDKVLEALVTYVEDMIQNASVEKWQSIQVGWFGGEPLINTKAIRFLSERFIALAAKYQIPYESSITTNGILLDEKNWMLLKEAKVSSVQVSIDGAKEVHDVYRPLKNRNSRNYEQILENITLMPQGIDLNIRVQLDNRVMATLPTFMDDLASFGLWPQRAHQISIDLAHLKHYEGANIKDMVLMSPIEFFEANQAFSDEKVRRYNKWAEVHGSKKARVRWATPKKQTDCATWVSPYFLTFDPAGTIHKCWETIHDESLSTQKDIFRKWNKEDFEKYLNYNRTTIHPTCQSCKFNPVCGGLSCAYDALHDIPQDKLPCTTWKTELPGYFKKMYKRAQETPELIAFDEPADAGLQTHANK